MKSSDSPHDCVGKLLRTFGDAIKPFIDQEMTASVGPNWRKIEIQRREELRRNNPAARHHTSAEEILDDPRSVLRILVSNWTCVFRDALPRCEAEARNLQTLANQHAHQGVPNEIAALYAHHCADTILQVSNGERDSGISDRIKILASAIVDQLAPRVGRKRKTRSKPRNTTIKAAKRKSSTRRARRKSKSTPPRLRRHVAGKRKSTRRNAITTPRIIDKRVHSAVGPQQDDRVTRVLPPGRLVPKLTAADIYAKWEEAYAVGDEAPGGDNPTPDQDRVDDIGRALGVIYKEDEDLVGGDQISERNAKRWELDPASSDDWPHKD